MSKLWLIAPIFLLSGCAAFAGKPSPVIQVNEAEQVKGCQLLKTFTSPAGYRMWGTPYIGDFKNKTLQEAERMGATHVLWKWDSEGIESVSVVMAYKCPVDQDTSRVREENRDED